MLVAVALVVLMMSLFATIFQFATQAMAIQKGTAENDQRVRLVMTLLRGDLKNRTMQNVLPFVASNDNTPITDNGFDVDNRQGYFYIAENDPNDQTDDVLQLTVESPNADDPYYGRATQIQGSSGISVDPNQPEFDDGFVNNNFAGSSEYAEVAYFLRRGNLYRRVVLIREPKVARSIYAGSAHAYNPKIGLTTTDMTGLSYYESAGWSNTFGNFYSDLDYSAYFDGTGPVFHGVASLDNSPGGPLFPLGKPNFRFGFYQGTGTAAVDLGMSGLPREFTTQSIDSTGTLQSSPPIPRYIGRFTHEETSFYQSGSNPFVSFGYPGRVAPPQSPNPYAPGTVLTYNDATGKVQIRGADNSGVPITYSGTRIAEDILMTNVREFDIKVWDDGASFGPDGEPGDAQFVSPGPDGILGTSDDIAKDDNEDASLSSDTTHINNISEVGWPGSDDGMFVDLGHNGFFPTLAPNFNGTVDVSFYSKNKLQNTSYCPTLAMNASRSIVQYRFDSWHPNVNLDQTNPILAPYDKPPFRAPDAVNETSGDVTHRPLRAIQIRIQFLDPTSQQLRDATLVQSLTD